MNKNLIFFAPGFSGMPLQSQNLLLTKFQKHGFDVISIKYPLMGIGGIQPIANNSLQLLGKVRDNYDHITFIGHSMGGLVGREIWQQAIHVPNSYRPAYDSYVSIATPHTGTQAALLGYYSRSARQMRPDSRYLKTLWYPDGLPCLNVEAAWDPIVPNAQPQSLFFDNVKIPWTEHATVLFAPRTFGEIYSWLVYGVLDEVESKSEGYRSDIQIT